MVLKYPDLSSGSLIETSAPLVLQQSLSGKSLLQVIFTDSIMMSESVLLVTLNLNVAGIARNLVELAAKFLSDGDGVLLIVDSPRM